jgi:LuxR family quorum-sensing transcriptional regulator LasR
LNWDTELTLAIQAVKTIPQAGTMCRKVAHSLGFPHFLFGMRTVLALDRPSQFILSGYPHDWRLRYDACGYMRIDPVLNHALANIQPFTWDELDRRDPAVAGLFDDAARHGLRHGVTVPQHGPHGNFSLLSLSREEPLPADPDELSRLFRHAQWFTMHLHERMRELIVEDGQLVVPAPTLSVRERACLGLAAQGHSAIAIGHRLSITERTAVFHLNHAVEKLGARSRQHAIALAISLGQLQPDTYPSQMELSHKLLELP